MASRNVLLSDQAVAKVQIKINIIDHELHVHVHVFSLIPFFLYLQVADFGLAREGVTRSDSQKLPVKWTAPEALKDNVCHTIEYIIHSTCCH